MGVVTEQAVLNRLRELDPEAWPEVCDFIGYLVTAKGRRAPERGSAADVMASYGAWSMSPEEQQRILNAIRQEREMENAGHGAHL